jgi:tight adherence protein B
MGNTVLLLVLYVTIGAASLFVADALVGFSRQARGIDDDAVSRRLASSNVATFKAESQVDLIRRKVEVPGWIGQLPMTAALAELIMQSGLNLRLERVLLLMAAIFVMTSAIAAYFLPVRYLAGGIMVAALIAVGPVIVVLLSARASKSAAFEEQLPDAIDLIVRSLRVGHPLSGAMQVIAKEMPAPIGSEFVIAVDGVTYGKPIPMVFAEMRKRVNVPDLAYLAMAVQIQQESGGNLAESLSKLSAVIRDRARMFRKVKALTAEGRFSAWALSFFPLGIAGMIQLIQPNYFTRVADFAYFPHLVVAAVIMLVLNVVMMQVITSLKV